MIEQKNILLSEIKPDPNQPRKYYDETAMDELIDSIREKGVLQPILVRPNGKGFILVCGERRYRAALSVNTAFKDRNTIPAVIREMSDDEALELQIIENLQRKDVHPMEEAVAFKSLIEKGKEVKEVAARVGKNEYYVKQRLKLNELSKDWQKAFHYNHLSISDALQVASLAPADQKDLYDDEVIKESIGKKLNYRIELNSYDFAKYRGNLSSAPFDIEDASLLKKAGACTICQFNSAVASLFPESTQAKCTNSACFKQKTELSFQKRIKESVESADTIFISTEYGSRDQEAAKLTKEHGITVLSRNSYSIVYQPELDREEWMGDNSDDYDTEKELNQAWEKELKAYQNEMDEYQRKIESGRYKKALVVIGDEKGQYVYVQVNGKEKVAGKVSSKDIQESIKAGKVTINELDFEIQQIQSRAKRNKELDQEKIFSKIKELLSNSKAFKESANDLNQEEIDAALLSMWKKSDFDLRNGLPKLTHFPGGHDIKKFWTKAKGTTSLGLNQFIRLFIINVLITGKFNNPDEVDSEAVYRVAKVYHPQEVAAIELEQQEVAQRRADNVAKRIKKLQEQKKALAEKTPTKKKAAKKK